MLLLFLYLSGYLIPLRIFHAVRTDPRYLFFMFGILTTHTLHTFTIVKLEIKTQFTTYSVHRPNFVIVVLQIQILLIFVSK